MKLALIQRTPSVPFEDLAVMACALQIQMTRDLAPALGLDPDIQVGAIPGTADAPRDIFAPVYFVDYLKTPGVLGEHADNGLPYGMVGVKTVLDAGGELIGGGALSVDVVASHEGNELLVDPLANAWVEGPEIVLPSGKRGHLYAREACDPVEATTYTVRTPDGTDVQVSDFVLSSWFTPGGKGPWSFRDAAPGPFRLAQGGYMLVKADDGSVEAVWGDQETPEQAVRRAARMHGSLRLQGATP